MVLSKITIFNENEITTAECNKSALMAFTRTKTECSKSNVEMHI